MSHMAIKPVGMPKAVAYGLVIGWVVVLAKCIVAPGLMERWQVPIHPGWVIVPTLIFAVLVTLLAWTHDWVGSEGD